MLVENQHLEASLKIFHVFAFFHVGRYENGQLVKNQTFWILPTPQFGVWSLGASLRISPNLNIFGHFLGGTKMANVGQTSPFCFETPQSQFRLQSLRASRGMFPNCTT